MGFLSHRNRPGMLGSHIQKMCFLFFVYDPQGLRKVSVGQKPHKHDFPKLEICQKRLFLEKSRFARKDELAKPFKGGSGGA